MKRMTWDEYKDFYNRCGRLPQQLSKPKNHLNENQIKRGYYKYIKSIEKQENRQKRYFTNKSKKVKERDGKWDDTRDYVFLRDGNRCQLLEILTDEEYRDVLRRAGHLIKTIDPAHIFSRNSTPDLYYDPENIVCLNRYSHSLLDSFRHPIYGYPITKEDQQKWWIRIIGKKHYDKLKERRENGRRKKY